LVNQVNLFLDDLWLKVILLQTDIFNSGRKKFI